MAVKRQAEKDKGEADRGAPGILEEDADCQRQRTENEKPRNNRIARTAVRAWHIGLSLAEPEERNDREAVENPSGENEKVRELFERPRERHKAGEHALENERPARREKFWMDAIRDTEEDFVARHGVRNARAAEDGRV